MNEMMREYAPDSQISANNNTGTQSWVNFSLSKDSREKLMTFALVASVLMLFWCWYTIDRYRSDLRLMDYDLHLFKAEKFAPLQAQVNADELLIQQCLNRSK